MYTIGAAVAVVGMVIFIVVLVASRRASRSNEAARMVAFVAQPVSAGPLSFGFPKLSSERGEIEMVTERGDLQVFDFKVIRDPGGARQAIVRTPCVVGSVAARCPVLTISRRGMGSAPGSSGLPDVAFESEMFNSELHVRSADSRFAHVLIDQRMMEWLLLFPPGWGIQTSGDRVLAFGNESSRAMQTGPVLEMLNDFLTHVPSAVRELFPNPV